MTQKPSLGGFLQNAGSNISDILNIPGNMVQHQIDNIRTAANIKNLPKDQQDAFIQNLANENTQNAQKFDVPSQILQMGGQALSTLGVTSTPQNGSIIPKIGFDGGKALQHAYDKPVDTAVSLLPLADIGGSALRAPRSLGGVEDALKTPINEASNGAADAQTSSPSKSSSFNPEADSPKNTSMFSNAKADPTAVQQYQSIFQVPRAVIQRMSIAPEKIINQLIQDGVTHVSNLDDLQHITQSVTGPNGAFPTISKIILGDIKEPLNLSNAFNAVPDVTNKFLEGSPKGLINQVNTEIQQALPKYDVMTDNLPEGHAYAQDAYTATQRLDKLANMYARKAYTQMGDLTNPSYERAASGIKEISNNIKDALDASVPKEVYQAYKQDPRVLEQLQRVPEKVAQRWLDNAQQFRDNRSIQAPYVGADQMIEHTKDAAFSASTNLMKKLGEMRPSDQIAENILNPIKAVKNAGAGILQKGISKFTDPTPEQQFQTMTSGGLPTPSVPASQISLAGSPVGALASIPPLDQQNTSQNSTQTPQAPDAPTPTAPQTPVSSITSVSQIPKSLNEITPDKTGNYSVANPVQIQGTDGQSLALSPDAYQNTVQQLNQQKSDPQYLNNPYFKANIDQQLDSLNSKKALSDQLLTGYQTASDLNDTMTEARSLIATAPVDVLSQFKSIDEMKKSTNPQYAQLAQDLDIIGQKIPSVKLFGQTKDSAVATLNSANQKVLNSYYKSLNSYTGSMTSAPDTVQNQIPSQSTFSPSAPPPNIQFGGGSLPALPSQAIVPGQGGGGRLPGRPSNLLMKRLITRSQQEQL